MQGLQLIGCIRDLTKLFLCHCQGILQNHDQNVSSECDIHLPGRKTSSQLLLCTGDFRQFFDAIAINDAHVKPLTFQRVATKKADTKTPECLCIGLLIAWPSAVQTAFYLVIRMKQESGVVPACFTD